MAIRWLSRRSCVKIQLQMFILFISMLIGLPLTMFWQSQRDLTVMTLCGDSATYDYCIYFYVNQVAFEDVLAEPEGSQSNDCVWRLSYRCFRGGKLCCYRCLTVFCGCFIALFWGCQFACVMFEHIWCYTPRLRLLAINCDCLQKLWGTTLQCLLAPVCETFGLCFSNIVINHTPSRGE